MDRRSLALLLLLGTACRPEAPPSKVVNPLPITRLTPGGAPAQQSGLQLATRTVVDDAATFETLWRQAFSTTGDTLPLPAVDWAKEKVVFAALGNRPSGGYSVAVLEAQQQGDELKITVETTTPGANCMTASVLTQPVDVVSIPRPAAGVLIRFVERERVANCP